MSGWPHRLPLLLFAIFSLVSLRSKAAAVEVHVVASTGSNALLAYSPEDLRRVRNQERLFDRRNSGSERATSALSRHGVRGSASSKTATDVVPLMLQTSTSTKGCNTPQVGWTMEYLIGNPKQIVEGILSTTSATILTPGFKTHHAAYRPWLSRTAHALPLQTAESRSHLALQLRTDLTGSDANDNGSDNGRSDRVVNLTSEIPISNVGDGTVEAPLVSVYQDDVTLGDSHAADVPLAVPRARNPCNTLDGPNGILGLGLPIANHPLPAVINRTSIATAPLLPSLLNNQSDFLFTPVLHPTHGHLVLGRDPVGLSSTFWSPSTSTSRWALNGSINGIIEFSFLVLDLTEDQGLIGPAGAVRALFTSLGLNAETDANGYVVAKVDDCDQGPKIDLWLGTNGVVLQGWLSVLRSGNGDCFLFVKGEDGQHRRQHGKATWRLGWRFNTRFTISYKYTAEAFQGQGPPLIGISLPPGVEGGR